MVKKVWIVLFILFAFTLISCTSQQSIAMTSEPIATFTPVVTNTPISIGKQDLAVVLTSYLDLKSSCKLSDRLGNSDSNIIFSEEVSQKVDDQTDYVSEIARSKNNKYSAYIVQRYALDIVSESIIPVYCEGCGRVYLEDNQDGRQYEISWNIFSPGISMIYSPIWVDDNILVIREAQSDDFYLVLGINVENQELVYLSEVSCSSK